MSIEKIDYTLTIPFKDFMPGTIIESKQFNDDMFDIETVINDIIDIYNSNFNNVNEHINNKENPHEVTYSQVGAYSTEDVDNLIFDLKEGNLNNYVLQNRVFTDECVNTRVIANKSITAIKVADSFGAMVDISENADIKNRYTKDEVIQILTERVGEGTYSREQIDAFLRDIQVGQIVVNSITTEQLNSNVGTELDISQNPSILERYTKSEIDDILVRGAVPRDWGSITDDTDDSPLPTPVSRETLPVADYMVVDTFTTPVSSILDIEVKEVVDSRGTSDKLNTRIDAIEQTISDIINTYGEVR